MASKRPQFLANGGIVTLTGALTTQAEMGLMRTCDANNDNADNIQDFSILRNTFGKSVRNQGYDVRADFNGDGTVNLINVSLHKANLSQSGAPPIRP